MTTIYTTIDGTLYETRAGRKDNEPNKIQIHGIQRFESASFAQEVQWADLEPSIQQAITRGIAKKFRAEDEE
jgi:hypothetical protein